MNSLVVGLIGVATVILFLFLGMPIGFSLALVGFVGFFYLSTAEAAFAVVGHEVLHALYNYNFTVLPLFILMGAVAARSGIGQRFYFTADKWLGQFPGGLALATIAGCAGFAAVSSSSIATAATMCKVSFPEMEKRGYKPELSAGSIATGGTLGVLIPPSGVLIVYAIITEQSIGKLFIAGIVPGITHALLYMALILVWTRLVPSLAPRQAVTVSIKERMASLGGTMEILLLFALVMGGMFFGIFTPTEAGAVGAAGAILIALARRILSWQQFLDALIDTARVVAMISLILVGAFIFMRLLSLSRLPFQLAELIAALHLSPLLIMIAILVSYVFMGCVIDTLGMTLITIPIYFPLIVALGFDPIWFGIIIVVVAEIGMITPPIGINVFVISGALPHIPIQTIFKGVLIFMIADITLVIFLVAFPQLATFLPNLMG